MIPGRDPILPREVREKIVMGALRKAADRFVRAAEDNGAKGMTIEEGRDRESLTITTSDPDSVRREFPHEAGEQPDSWVFRAATAIGGAIR